MIPQPAICKWEDQASGVSFSQFESLGTRCTGVQGQQKVHVPAQADRELTCLLPLCSLQALSGLGDCPPAL